MKINFVEEEEEEEEEEMDEFAMEANDRERLIERYQVCGQSMRQVNALVWQLHQLNLFYIYFVCAASRTGAERNAREKHAVADKIVGTFPEETRGRRSSRSGQGYCRTRKSLHSIHGCV